MCRGRGGERASLLVEHGRLPSSRRYPSPGGASGADAGVLLQLENHAGELVPVRVSLGNESGAVLLWPPTTTVRRAALARAVAQQLECLQAAEARLLSSSLIGERAATAAGSHAPDGTESGQRQQGRQVGRLCLELIRLDASVLRAVREALGG